MKKVFKQVLCAALATTMVVSLTACGSKKDNSTASSGSTAKAGSYTATAKGNNGDVKFKVTIEDNKIKSIEVVESSETAGLGDTAMEKLTKEIIDGQSIGVDTVTGATNSSKALLTAVEDCLKQAGADVDSFKQAAEKVKGEDETKETQVVVVGGGASGTAAALQAAEDGAKVILVEMTASPQGQGTQAGGLFGTNSSQQKKSNQVVSDEWYYDQFMETSNYTANMGLLSNVIKNSGKTVDWLESYGCKLTLALPGTGSYVEHVSTHPASTIHGYTEGGTQGITNLHASLKKLGGEVLYSTTAKELIMKDGKAAGIKAEKEDGGILTINADSVILATGGFGGNEEKVAEVFGEGFGQSRIATNIGTGIEMAISAGADASYENAITMHYGVSRGGTAWGSVLNSALLNPWLHVDVDGNRFMNEEAFIHEPIKSSDVIKSLPTRTAYEIFDSSLIETVKKSGAAGITDFYPGKLTTDPTKFIEVGHEIDTAKSSKLLQTPTDLTEEIEKLVKEGTIIKADSVEELAKKLGMSNLEETVTQYNKLCDNKKDTDHHKSAKYLDKVEGPVYAVKITPSVFLGTLGGIEINDKCQVLNKEGKAIEGLYSAGAETSGVYGNSYVFFEGGTLGYAYGSGRIAGQSAAKQVTSNK
ncbi:fumarate reductase flavoprotein subunit [Lachnospiraceae bacterium KM106-2]|nr:fumarate reductase flavoprotein subunit [Lachnospiraceae bacterium KM106-2]